jgi:hypothetical protein
MMQLLYLQLISCVLLPYFADCSAVCKVRQPCLPALALSLCADSRDVF